MTGREDRVVVRAVESWRDRRRFQRFPWAIYAGSPPDGWLDPNWVPPILARERALLGWGHHPFFESAEIVTLLAERDGRTLGRLAAIVNHDHNRTYGDRLGFFGFFECVNDATVARALFERGGDWLRERGMTAMRGPVNPSLNYTCGLLIDAFDQPPRFLMTYNPPYYAALVEACGFAKSQDLYAYELDAALLATGTARYKPLVVAALARTDLVLRPFDLSRRAYRRDLAIYLDLYNRSLEGTWGFTPLRPREARHMADDLRRVIVPQFAVFAELDGQPIGAMLALLDYNQLLRRPQFNGRLLPFGLLRLMLGRRGITAARVVTMTMAPGYQSSGFGLVLLDSLVEAAKRWRTSGRGIETYECSWVLESNARSRGSLEHGGARIARTYRIYDRAL